MLEIKAKHHGSRIRTSLRSPDGIAFGIFCSCVFLYLWPVTAAQLPVLDTPAALTTIANNPGPQESINVSSLGLSNSRPVAQVANCFDAQHGAEPLKPASYEAYERHEEVARLLPFKLWRSDRTPPQQILTVVTTLTANRVDMLTAQCESWSGPLSAVLYVPLVVEADQMQSPGQFTPEQLSALQKVADSLDQLLNRMALVPDSCTLTVMLAYEFIHRNMVDHLPINGMRNQALLLARTPLVTMLDVDLLISSRFGADLREPEAADELIQLVKGQKVFAVLPAFDPDIVCATRGENTEFKFKQRVIAEQQKLAVQAVKGGKRTVQGLFKLKVLEPFNHQVNPEGHADTKFHHWLRCNKPACSSYKVNAKSPKFEPWGIVDRELALRHPYDEVYRGYGKNKIMNILHLMNEGFELRVLGSGFVVHRPHWQSDAKLTWVKEGKGKDGVHLNSVKFEQMQTSLANKTYTPQVASHTAACIETHLKLAPVV